MLRKIQFTVRSISIFRHTTTVKTPEKAYKRKVFLISMVFVCVLTPNALNRFRLGCRSCLFKNTSDFGLGGFFGRIMTRVSSRMSSSSSLLSDDTDNCRWTRSWSFAPDQSANQKKWKISNVIYIHVYSRKESCIRSLHWMCASNNMQVKWENRKRDGERERKRLLRA